METDAQLPGSLDEFRKLEPQFRGWLLRKNATLLVPTNPYEVLRFKLRMVQIVFMNAKEKITSWYNGADTTWREFIESQVATPEENLSRLKTKKALLRARDGDNCFYCGLRMCPDEMTKEHMLPKAFGGTDGLINLALAHRKCNSLAGHLSVREKCELAIKMRGIIWGAGAERPGEEMAIKRTTVYKTDDGVCHDTGADAERYEAAKKIEGIMTLSGQEFSISNRAEIIRFLSSFKDEVRDFVKADNYAEQK